MAKPTPSKEEVGRRLRDEDIPAPPPRLLPHHQVVPSAGVRPDAASAPGARRGSFSLALDTNDNNSSPARFNGMDCRNGRVFVGLCCGGPCTYGVHSPLHPTRGVVSVPTAPYHLLPHNGKGAVISHVLSKQVGDGLSYFWLSLHCNQKGKATAYFFTLQDDAWFMHTPATTNIPRWPQSKQRMNSFLTIDDKIFLVITVNYILVFDSTSLCFFTIDFPDRLAFDGAKILLSQANDSGLYLVHVKGLELSIWLFRGVNGSVGDWLLFDTFCLRDMCANLRMSDCMTEDGDTIVVKLVAVADNAEFVFLEIEACVFYLDVRSRALHKVYELTETDEVKGYIHIRPFMMIWPPTFPALEE